MAVKYAVMLALLLAGCSTPAVRVETVEVKVPVPVQPLRAEQVPQLPAPLPKRPADARDALAVALAGYCRMVAYALRADPLLRLSAGLPPKDASAYPECER